MYFTIPTNEDVWHPNSHIPQVDWFYHSKIYSKNLLDSGVSSGWNMIIRIGELPGKELLK